MEISEIINKAKDLGAVSAKLISTDSIILGDWVRLKCQYGCGGYGKSLCCPPHSPTPETMSRVLEGYNKALLMHFDRDLVPKEVSVKMERFLFLHNYPKAFGMGAGPCRLCGSCNGEHCVKPKEARPAMEACGIDVYSTVRNSGYEVQVLKDRDCQGNWFALVLME